MSCLYKVTYFLEDELLNNYSYNFLLRVVIRLWNKIVEDESLIGVSSIGKGRYFKAGGPSRMPPILLMEVTSNSAEAWDKANQHQWSVRVRGLYKLMPKTEVVHPDQLEARNLLGHRRELIKYWNPQQCKLTVNQWTNIHQGLNRHCKNKHLWDGAGLEDRHILNISLEEHLETISHSVLNLKMS